MLTKPYKARFTHVIKTHKYVFPSSLYMNIYVFSPFSHCKNYLLRKKNIWPDSVKIRYHLYAMIYINSIVYTLWI